MNFFIGKNGQQLGPFSQDQVRSMIDGGMLSANDLAWHEGRADWAPLGQILGFTTASPYAPPLANPSTGCPPTHQPAKASTGLIISGYVCAVISVLFLPVIFGPAGIVIGIKVLRRNETGHGVAIIALSAVLCLIGSLIGAMMAG
jgi:hypothetical protein